MVRHPEALGRRPSLEGRRRHGSAASTLRGPRFARAPQGDGTRARASEIIPAAPLRPRVMPNPVPSSRKTGSFEENERGGASVSRRACPVSLNQRNARTFVRLIKKEAERRQTLVLPAAPSGAALPPAGDSSPVGVPPQLSPKGVVLPKAQLQARFPGTRSDA